MGSLEQILPALSSFLGGIKFLMVLMMLAGPLVMLYLGLKYYYKAPQEVDYEWGFRTYFALTTPDIWSCTQKIAGKTWMLLGGAMSVLALVMSVVLCFFSARAVTVGAVWIVSIELLLTVVSWFVINTIILKIYDKNGKRRTGADVRVHKFLKP